MSGNASRTGNETAAVTTTTTTVATDNNQRGGGSSTVERRNSDLQQRQQQEFDVVTPPHHHHHQLQSSQQHQHHHQHHHHHHPASTGSGTEATPGAGPREEEERIIRALIARIKNSQPHTSERATAIFDMANFTFNNVAARSTICLKYDGASLLVKAAREEKKGSYPRINSLASITNLSLHHENSKRIYEIEGILDDFLYILQEEDSGSSSKKLVMMALCNLTKDIPANRMRLFRNENGNFVQAALETIRTENLRSEAKNYAVMLLANLAYERGNKYDLFHTPHVIELIIRCINEERAGSQVKKNAFMALTNVSIERQFAIKLEKIKEGRLFENTIRCIKEEARGSIVKLWAFSLLLNFSLEEDIALRIVDEHPVVVDLAVHALTYESDHSIRHEAGRLLSRLAIPKPSRKVLKACRVAEVLRPIVEGKAAFTDDRLTNEATMAYAILQIPCPGEPQDDDDDEDEKSDDEDAEGREEDDHTDQEENLDSGPSPPTWKQHGNNFSGMTRGVTLEESSPDNDEQKVEESPLNSPRPVLQRKKWYDDDHRRHHHQQRESPHPHHNSRMLRSPDPTRSRRAARRARPDDDTHHERHIQATPKSLKNMMLVFKDSINNNFGGWTLRLSLPPLTQLSASRENRLALRESGGGDLCSLLRNAFRLAAEQRDAESERLLVVIASNFAQDEDFAERLRAPESAELRGLLARECAKVRAEVGEEMDEFKRMGTNVREFMEWAEAEAAGREASC